MSTLSGTGAVYLRSSSGAQSIHSRPLSMNVLQSGSVLTSFSPFSKKTSMLASVTSANVVLLKNRTHYLLDCENRALSPARRSKSAKPSSFQVSPVSAQRGGDDADGGDVHTARPQRVQ
jgi:hypothetical protein